MVTTCTVCGGLFSSSPTGGRPRSRCDGCRSNHARINGTVWRKLRARVLAEEPDCSVAGCGRRSTQVDHITPLKLRPDLALERWNLRGICATHNASKGAKLPGLVLSEPDYPDPDRRCSCGDPTCPGRWHL